MSTAYALHALETTWNVAPASGYREVEVDGDTFKTKRDVQTRPPGLRRNTGAPRAANRRAVNKGGEGSIDLVAATNGLGPFLACAASTAASALVAGASTAHAQTFTWTAAGPPVNRSLTTELYRDRVSSGTLDVFTHTGGRATSVDFSAALDQFLAMKFAMDYADVVRQTSDPSRTVVEVDPDLLYNWQDPIFTLTPKGGDPEDDGNAECITDFGLTLPNALNVDRWCMKRGTTKHEPTRSGTPAPTGNLTWDYDHPRYYDAWIGGDLFTLSAVWQSPVKIETVTAVDIFPSLTVDIATIGWTGEDPVADPTNPTKQNLPFEVLDDDSGDPVVTVTQITTDTAL